jgi:hypothetical protein
VRYEANADGEHDVRCADPADHQRNDNQRNDDQSNDDQSNDDYGVNDGRDHYRCDHRINHDCGDDHDDSCCATATADYHRDRDHAAESPDRASLLGCLDR